ncbi:MAG: DUF4202 domain-containing protein [Planctomycetota bacterium]|nr:DUF4202 domain-containing protein [Planctomycetota bacterium]MCX8039335.1 DUF4202 domain-containing protein [Planctomycetota bacterium]MDW8373626.1 DUF4202 domain-containing protein [Planctomycetota bacterium]
MSTEHALAAARAAIDAVHARDPEQRDGRPAELAYADAMEAWVLRLRPDADPVLRLAARAQHLARWELPRAAYPMDRAGYLRWRSEQYHRQAALAGALCRAAGVAEADAQRLERLVAKRDLKQPDGQLIEDAACLVFLEREALDFARAHPEYDRAKLCEILAKTLRKMSAAARAAALALPLPAPLAELLQAAHARLQPASPA